MPTVADTPSTQDTPTAASLSVRGEAHKHILELDGIRGVAILSVFLLHTIVFPPGYSGFLVSVLSFGHFGVDLFFCLSGFLITGILWSSKRKDGYFRNFYARRALRIFPLYYTYLVLYYFAVVHFHIVSFGKDKLAQAAQDLHWTWFYGTNFLIALRGDFITASLNHFWTLAVEEHFYFIWPLIVYFCIRRRLIQWTFGILTACFALRLTLQLFHVPFHTIESLTFCRIDSFAFAGLTAVLQREEVWRERFARLLPVALPGSFAICALTYYRWTALFPSIGILATTIFCTSLLILITTYREILFSRWLRTSPMRFLGKYSYSLYIFHFPIQIFVERKIPTAKLATRLHSWFLATSLHMLLVGIVSVAVALLTWNLLEKQFLGLKRFFPSAA